MAIKVKITATALFSLEPALYQAAWEEHCDDSGDMEEGDDYPPITDEFVLERFQENLEDGSEDLSAVLETADIDVQEVK